MGAEPKDKAQGLPAPHQNKPETQEHLIQQCFPPRDVGRAAAEGTARGSTGVLCHSGETHIISTLPASHMPNGWLNTAS